MDARSRAPGPDLRPLALAFTAGVLLVHALPALPSLFSLCALAAAALWPWRGRLLLLAGVLGLALTTWQAQRQRAEQWPASRDLEERWVQGTIASLPERSLDLRDEGEAPELTWRFSFAPRPHEAGVPSLVRVSWYRADAELAGGQCWRFRLRLRSPHGSLNPGGFDYEAWLFRQRLGATATVREAEPCGVAPGYRVLKLRQALAARVDAVLGERPGGALLKALTLGATAGLHDADWDVLRLTGTTHLIAISGFNLALVAGFAFFVLRWTWSAIPRACLWLPAQRFALLGSVALAAAYALVAGFEAPVARALFMLLAVLLATLLHRPAEPGRALAFAWLAILIADPFAVMAPGLWLSFGAVAAIFYVAGGRWRREPAWRAAVRVQLFLSLVLAPLSLHYFHGLAWAAPFVNLVAVPLFALLTPLCLLLLLASLVSAAAAATLLPPAAWMLETLMSALGWLAAHWPGAWLPAAPPAAALALAVLGCLLLFAPAGLPLRAAGMLCVLPLLWPPQPPPRGGLELTVLDVGQGLAVVVRTAKHSLLYDAGPAYEDGFDSGASIVAPFLLRQGLRDLDLLLLSHGDNDHSGGLPAVRRLLAVRREIGTSAGEPCRDGAGWEWDGVRFTLLQAEDLGLSDNNSSCALKIDGPFSVLLPGDIERQAEARLLDRHAALLPADLLLAPHHGSKTSSTPAFVAAVRPRLVIFSSGWHNRYGHPRPEVVRRYLDCGARLAMSGEAGALTVFRDDESLRLERWRERAGRFWNAGIAASPYWRRDAEAMPRAGCGAG